MDFIIFAGLCWYFQLGVRLLLSNKKNITPNTEEPFAQNTITEKLDYLSALLLDLRRAAIMRASSHSSSAGAKQLSAALNDTKIVEALKESLFEPVEDPVKPTYVSESFVADIAEDEAEQNQPKAEVHQLYPDDDD